MAEEKNKYFGKTNLKQVWDQFRRMLGRKLESVTSQDNSVTVTDKRRLSVKLSKAKGNAAVVNNFPGEEGLYVPDKANGLKHTLTFGSDQQYVFDGSEDILVPVYTGDVNKNN